MITQKIEKYKEPAAYVYQTTTYQATQFHQHTFTPKEIQDAKELAVIFGIQEGLVLKHTPTDHILTVLGWVPDNKVVAHKNKPCIVSVSRKRGDCVWETEYSVDELMLMEYKTVLDEVKP